MKSISGDILTEFKATTFSVTVPSENILDAYPPTMPAFTKPYVFVNEIDNRANLDTYTNREEHSILSYEIEIYAKQQKVGSDILSPLEVVKTLGHEINEVMQTKFSAVRVGSPAPLPFATDGTIMRYILTYQCVIDLTTDFLYRP